MDGWLALAGAALALAAVGLGYWFRRPAVALAELRAQVLGEKFDQLVQRHADLQAEFDAYQVKAEDVLAGRALLAGPGDDPGLRERVLLDAPDGPPTGSDGAPARPPAGGDERGPAQVGSRGDRVADAGDPPEGPLDQAPAEGAP